MTMAEIMILILFCLLMAFVLQLEEYEAIEEKIARLDELSNTLDQDSGTLEDDWQLISIIEKLATQVGLDTLVEVVDSLPNDSDISEKTVAEVLETSMEHYNLAKRKLEDSTGKTPSSKEIRDELQRQSKQSEDWEKTEQERSAYQALKRSLGTDDVSREDLEDAVNAASETYAKLFEAYTKRYDKDPSPEDLTSFSEEQLADAEAWRESDQGDIGEKYVEAISENQNLRDRVSQIDKALNKAKTQLRGKGQGLEYPSCFETPEGRIQYVYAVEFGEDTLKLIELPVPGNEELKARLPFDKIIVDQNIEPALYSSITRPIYEWSIQNECRFFVRVFDNTSAANKQQYKKMMRHIESRFYKWEDL